MHDSNNIIVIVLLHYFDYILMPLLSLSDSTKDIQNALFV